MQGSEHGAPGGAAELVAKNGDSGARSPGLEAPLCVSASLSVK